MDSVVPFIFGVDDGDGIRALKFLGEDQWFDVVDVAGLIGFEMFSWSARECVNWENEVLNLPLMM